MTLDGGGQVEERWWWGWASAVFGSAGCLVAGMAGSLFTSTVPKALGSRRPDQRRGI